MKILCVDCLFAKLLKQRGHEVLELNNVHGILSLPHFLKSKNFFPDLIIQQENIKIRLILSGLEEVDCLKLFWSIDTHINLHWQIYYFKLFDAVLTPHYSWLKKLEKINLPLFFRLPLPAPFLSYKAYENRTEELSFVGRFTKFRPLRQRLKDAYALLGYQNFIEEISYRDMLKLYSNTKLVPNESLGYELNLRIFESAGAGAVVLAQNIGEDQDAVFEPQKECVIWHDIIELFDLTKYYLKNESLAKKISEAGYARVQKEHLIEQRLNTLLYFMKNITQNTRNKVEDRKNLWLSLVQLVRNNMLDFSYLDLLGAADGLADDCLMVAFKIILLTENQQYDDARRLIHSFSTNKELCVNVFSSDYLLLLSSCSASAMFQDDFNLAKYFLLMYYNELVKSNEAQALILFNQVNCQPISEFELCLSWARLFENKEILSWIGFKFYPYRKNSEEKNNFEYRAYMPQCSLSWLLTAKTYKQDQNLKKYLEALVEKTNGLSSIYQDELSDFIVKSANSSLQWRFLTELGVKKLEQCQFGEGLSDIKTAFQLATEKNIQANFHELLSRLTSQERKENILNCMKFYTT
ncbi:glycosyltransferase [Desulfovibrio litoralis]|uniref:Glycosyl transferases group 1 n=1 Tax=Desulfovibrio litoralis DSM 11393 TaxID=1121455 RepID=A0A1M7TK59_9BACT|nr:glycosyltransferase [Desulfovibrio litoralis]SHN71023.1 Glycosyl transferases group 1 [Desulfovibrio litoralis DSM 11393]